MGGLVVQDARLSPSPSSSTTTGSKSNDDCQVLVLALRRPGYPMATSEAYPPLLAVGQLVDDRYRIVRVLGQGGMGAVYVAEQVALAREVALKVLQHGLAHDPASARRFEREARAASSIRHPNVVEIFDFGKLSSGCFYYVMERLEGEDLSHRLARKGRLTWPRARQLLLQLVRALAAAHEQGIIHRDIKPSNCFVVKSTRRNDPETVKLLDFGIVKTLAESSETAALTAANDVIGTPSYMAPEQAMGGTIDGRTDIYALGVVMYQLLTGQVPFTASTGVQILVLHTQKDPPPPRELEPSILPAVEGIILRALAKDPNARFQSMEQFEQALEEVERDDERPVVARSSEGTMVLATATTTTSSPTEILSPVTGAYPDGAPLPDGTGPRSLSSTLCASTGLPSEEHVVHGPPTTRPSASAVVSPPPTGPHPGSTYGIAEGTTPDSPIAPPFSTGLHTPRPSRRWLLKVALVVAAVGTTVGYGPLHPDDLRERATSDDGPATSRRAAVSDGSADDPATPASGNDPVEIVPGVSVTVQTDAAHSDSESTPTLQPTTLEDRLTRLVNQGILPAQAWLGHPGSLSGHITRVGTSTPIHRARVCAWMLDPRAPSDLRRKPRCVRTDDTGRYTLDDLPPSYYDLTASAKHLQSAHHGEDLLVLRSGDQPTGLDLELDQGGVALEGYVRDQAGAVLRGATVRVTADSRPMGYAVTNGRGAFSVWVEPGEYRLEASAKRHSPGYAERATTETPAEITLIREVVWVGRVLWQGSDAPAHGVKIELGGELTYTDDEGRVRIEGLSPGQHDARLDVPGSDEHLTIQLELTLGQTQHATLHLPRAAAPPTPPSAETDDQEAPPPPPIDPKAASRKKLARTVKRACRGMNTRVSIQLHTGTSGRVASLRVKAADGGHLATEIETCVMNAARRKKYPLRGGGFVTTEVGL